VTIVAALGDSFTCGEGVGVRIDPAATWAAVLARALPDGRLVRLAAPGARVVDVQERQVPLLPSRVDVATLVVGLNDIARAGFVPEAARVALLDVVTDLLGRGAEVLLGRLHDPTRLLPLPSRVARATRARIGQVNDVVDIAATWPGVHVLDLALVPALGRPGGWSVDRIHPSAVGHRGMAAEAVVHLRAGGRMLPEPVAQPVIPRGPLPFTRGWWAVRHGVPYAAGHLRELGAPLASAVLGRG
jgi:lysophospholipase L1-like esterase